MAGQTLEKIREERIKKLNLLREKGINPYPSKLVQKPQKIADARKKEGDKVTVAGRIWGWREHGNSIFADLKDETGKIQIFFQKKNLEKDLPAGQAGFETVKLFDVGDFVLASGKVFKTVAGEITIDVTQFQLLTKSIRPLPSAWHGLRDVEERYRQRYVDLLMNSQVRNVFETRTKIVKLLRKYLDEEGFIEITTPALQPIYGGATAKPFITHHNALDVDLYLRIADELYLKRLIVGGFEKVYEIATDFRNEGIDRWHNPEFEMLEFYWAYANYEDLMKMTEEMLSWVVMQVKGSHKVEYGGQKIDFKPPWKRVTFKYVVLKETGIDLDEIGSFEKLADLMKKKGLSFELKEAADLASGLDGLYKAYVRPKIIDPTFVIDHPYVMRPLAKKKESDPNKVESIQLIVAGAELLNAYTELNDPIDQKARWEEDMKRAKKGAKEYQVVDKDYIRALEYGMPPTAGWGMGIERFTAILTDQHSIKDTILFPTLRPEE